MASCVHLIQQSHDKLPLDALNCIAQEDVIVVMNNNHESYLSIKMIAPNTCPVHALNTIKTEKLSKETINYAQLVKIIAQHDKSISW